MAYASARRGGMAWRGMAKIGGGVGGIGELMITSAGVA